MVLIFSPAIFWCRRYYSHFSWIISLSKAYLFSTRFCLSSSFSSFRIFSAPSLPCTFSAYSLHTFPFSSNFSSPLSLSSPVGLPLASLFLILKVVPGWCGWGGGAGQHLISYLRINHEILSTQSSSDPSANLSANSGSLIQTHKHTHSTD